MSALSKSAGQQGAYGASGDTCFSGGFLCGTSRFEVLRSQKDLIFEPSVNRSDMTYQFGGSKSTVHSSWTVQLGTNAPKFLVDVVDGSASGLPLLFGILIMRRISSSINFTGESLKITFGSRCVNVWEAGGLPTCDVRDIIRREQNILVLRTNAEVEGLEPGDNMINPVSDVVAVDAPPGAEVKDSPVENAVELKPSVVEIGDKLSLTQVEKSHSQSHASVERLYSTFLSAFGGLSEKERSIVRAWCVHVVKTCPECSKFGIRVSAGTILRGALLKNERGHIDLLCLDSGRDIYCIAIVDEGTRDFALGIVSTRQSEDVFRAYILAWGVHHGCHRFLFSDGDGCFSSRKFVDLCVSFGIVKEAGPGEASESYGIVERSIGTARTSLDRVFADPNGPRDRTEWSLSVALIANGIRNEIRSSGPNGSTASERSIGSNSSIFSNFLSDMEISGHTGCAKSRLVQIKDLTCREFYSALNSEKLRLMGKERGTRARNVLVDNYVLGERVEFYRPSTSRGATWHTGKVVGIMPTSDQISVEYFHIDESGALLRVAARHVRKSGIEPVVEQDWSFTARKEKPEEREGPLPSATNVHNILKPATSEQPANPVLPDDPDVALHTTVTKAANDVPYPSDDDDDATFSGFGSDPDSDFETDLVTLICSGGEYSGGVLHLGVFWVEMQMQKGKTNAEKRVKECAGKCAGITW